MMCQRVVVLRQALGKEGFNGLCHAFMQDPPPLQQHGGVGDFLRQRVLKRVFRLGEEGDLIEELRDLQVRQAALHVRRGKIHGGLEDRRRDVFADDRGRLQQVFRFHGQAIDAGGQHRLHSGGDLNLRHRPGEPIRAPFTPQQLSLGINPVEILADQQQRLHLAFAQQHPFEAIEDALAALRGIERQKRAVLGHGIQQRQQRRDDRLQGFVERQHLAGDFGPDGPRLVALLDLTVALQQLDEREIGGGLARHRPGPGPAARSPVRSAAPPAG